MGITFPSLAFSMAKFFPILPIKAVFRHLFHMFLATLARSGLLRLCQRGGGHEEEPFDHSTDMVLVMDGSCPSLVHVDVLTALIKKRIPLVEYGAFLYRNDMEWSENATCLVCLSGLEKSDQIRELSNCGHVFHRHCLDSWVDLHHVTCPLCRSLLLPRSSANMAYLGSRQGGETIETRRDEQLSS